MKKRKGIDLRKQNSLSYQQLEARRQLSADGLIVSGNFPTEPTAEDAVDYLVQIECEHSQKDVNGGDNSYSKDESSSEYDCKVVPEDSTDENNTATGNLDANLAVVDENLENNDEPEVEVLDVEAQEQPSEPPLIGPVAESASLSGAVEVQEESQPLVPSLEQVEIKPQQAEPQEELEQIEEELKEEDLTLDAEQDFDAGVFNEESNKKFKKEQNPKQQGDFVLEENLSPQDSEQPSAQVLEETDEAFKQLLDLEPMNEELDSKQRDVEQIDLQTDPQIDETEQEPVVEEQKLETTYIQPSLFKRLFDLLRSASASSTS